MRLSIFFKWNCVFLMNKTSSWQIEKKDCKLTSMKGHGDNWQAHTSRRVRLQLIAQLGWPFRCKLAKLNLRSLILFFSCFCYGWWWYLITQYTVSTFACCPFSRVKPELITNYQTTSLACVDIYLLSIIKYIDPMNTLTCTFHLSLPCLRYCWRVGAAYKQ